MCTSPGVEVAPYRGTSALVYAPILASLALLSVIILADLNHTLFFAVNSVSEITGQALWANLTILGDTLIAAILFTPWIRRRPDVIWAVICGGIIAFVVSHGLKQILDIPRPPALLGEESINVIGPAHRRSSFPSGHATTAFTVAGVWILSIRPIWIRSSLLVVALVVAASRVAVGVHWPADIVGGFLAGWLSAWLGIALTRRYPLAPRRPGHLVIAVLLLIACLYALFFFETGYKDALLLQRILAATALAVGLREMYVMSASDGAER